MGQNIDYDKVRRVLEELGASIHSIDKVSSGNELIKEAILTRTDQLIWYLATLFL
jgi:hypothetical protein